MPTVTFTSSTTWTFPSDYAPGSLVCQAWGEGGTSGAAAGGSPHHGGGGGGGGEFAQDDPDGTAGVTVLTITIGTGGTGTATTVTGGTITVTAHAGAAGSTLTGGAGGSGSTNAVQFNGGGGGSSASTTNTLTIEAGGGGGSSAGTAAIGGTGGAGGGSAGAGGAAPSGGGNGGSGSASTGTAGTAGTAPGGGGGGGAGANASLSGTGAGAHGQVILTWSNAITSTGGLVLAPLAFSGIITGNVTGGLSLAPLHFSGTAVEVAQVLIDVPQINPGPSWLSHYKPWLPKRPRPTPEIPPFMQGGLALGSLRFSGQGSVQNLFIFIGHYAVSYPDYADANTLEMLSCLPQHSYQMYVVGFRAGLQDPPTDGRWQGVPGIGDEVVFVRRYEDALAIARSHNATLQAVNARQPYEQVSGGIPQPRAEVPREPSGHSKMLSAGRALNAELQARMARGEAGP
mgnify:CR=1 FL=1